MRDFKYRVFIDGHMHMPCIMEEYANIRWHGINVIASEDDERKRAHVMFSSGLKDKNGKEIYEGDILCRRSPERLTQTHTGDNIPLGSYTEPLEPIIKESKDIVIFDNGGFCVNDSFALDYYGEDQACPLAWETIQYNIDIAKDCFCGGWSSYGNKFDWDGEDGDLQYLLHEYNLSNEKELISYLGIEIIGNIHENPELL